MGVVRGECLRQEFLGKRPLFGYGLLNRGAGRGRGAAGLLVALGLERLYQPVHDLVGNDEPLHRRGQASRLLHPERFFLLCGPITSQNVSVVSIGELLTCT